MRDSPKRLWAGLPAFLFLLVVPAVASGADGAMVYRDILGLDSRTVVWVVAELHLMFAAFVLGVPIFAVIVELVGKRTGDPRYDKLAREFTTLLTAAFATTAAFGGLLAFLLIGLYPTFMVHLGSVMHETFYVYAALFFAEAFTLYAYYYSWERMTSTAGRAPGARRVLKTATVVLGLLALGVMLFGRGNPGALRAEGRRVADRIGSIAKELEPFLERSGGSVDAADVAAAVAEAATSDAGPAEAPGDAGPAVEKASAVVAAVAEAVLADTGREQRLGEFSRRIEEAKADEKLRGFNRGSDLSARRWMRIGLLLLLFLGALGVTSYLSSLKSLHLYLGLLLNIIGLVLMMIANSWATYMMAPSGINEATFEFGGTTWGAVTNVLWNPVNIHRFIANVVFGGFVAAAYAAVKFLGARTDAERAHYDWMGYVGNFVGMAAMLPLPFAGYYLGREIYSYSSVMGNNMMGGAFSWTFILQAMLIGMLFVSANYYLWLGMQRIEGAERYRKYIPWNTVILMFSFAVWLTPHNLPLSGSERILMGGEQFHPVLKYFGLMPAKNAVVNFIILSTFFSFLMYRRANKGEVRPFRSHGPAAMGTVVGVAALCIVLLASYANVVRHVDLAEISTPLSSRWVLDGAAYALLVEALFVVLVTVLALRDRGVLAQFVFFGSTAVLVTGFLGVWGFVTMVKANAFLRNIAVCQVLMVLTCLMLNTTIDIVLFRGAPAVGKINWGKIPGRSQYALVLCCISVVMLMGLMGFIRSGLREDWHIFGVLRDTSAGAGTPTNAYMARVVGGITPLFLGLVAFVFWLAGLGGAGDRRAAAPAGESRRPGGGRHDRSARPDPGPLPRGRRGADASRATVRTARQLRRRARAGGALLQGHVPRRVSSGRARRSGDRHGRHRRGDAAPDPVPRVLGIPGPGRHRRPAHRHQPRRVASRVPAARARLSPRRLRPGRQDRAACHAVGRLSSPGRRDDPARLPALPAAAARVTADAPFDRSPLRAGEHGERTGGANAPGVCREPQDHGTPPARDGGAVPGGCAPGGTAPLRQELLAVPRWQGRRKRTHRPRPATSSGELHGSRNDCHRRRGIRVPENPGRRDRPSRHRIALGFGHAELEEHAERGGDLQDPARRVRPGRSLTPRTGEIELKTTLTRILALALVALSPWRASAGEDPYGAERLMERKKQVPENEANLSAGRRIYRKRCALCHGDQGRGDGGAAPYLDPRPRDFTLGLFKFRSTLTGELPTDEDLFRTISRGVPGTAMPAWGEGSFVLPEEERWQVIHYLKKLSTEDFADPDFDPYDQLVEIPSAPPYTSERVAAGEALYSDEKKGGCVKCHGNAGRGDGKESGTQKDNWGDAILPTDLTRPWRYKNGSSRTEVFRTFSTGLNGTPMPGYAETLSEAERWDLACFVKSLQVDLGTEGQIVLRAAKHDGPLPLDPGDRFWEQQPRLDVPLAGQVVVTPRHANGSINLVSVRAAYNDDELALHFTWNDRFKNASPPGAEDAADHWVPDLDRPDSYVFAAEVWARRAMELRDQLQIQFPVTLQEGPSKPYFLLGDAANRVNLWTWRADWNERPGEHGGSVCEERNAAGYATAPAAQDTASQALEGRAAFADGRWELVLKRSRTTPDGAVDTQFEPGVFVPFALQAWDGGNGEEGLLCSMSTWYYLQLEGRIETAGYVWSLLGVLLTLGGGRLAVRQAKRTSVVHVRPVSVGVARDSGRIEA